MIDHPDKDRPLRVVEEWLLAKPLSRLLTLAVEDAVQYVLDGARTGRFDLNDPEVDSDERRSVGVKLQYRVINELGLEKQKPLDTVIVGVAVDIKATVGNNWTIPKEAQCELCILIQVDAEQDRHRAFLMRTHRRWLNEGKNMDSKRNIASLALKKFARPLYDWTPLPPNPLKLLTTQQRDVIFAPRMGQEKRLVALFGALPDIVIPRWAILTVCANRQDPLRRVRAVRAAVAAQHGLQLYGGKYRHDRAAAAAVGFDLADASWVATARTAADPTAIPSP